MTDDEAFVRAVVDAPGDDTPRLVYADWLDDRGDPARAAYLRAERAAVAAGDATGLRDRATGLDPVWVARVSRPPVGVCCDGLTFDRPGPPSSADRVAKFEARHRIELCDQYRAFLLNTNGGSPRPARGPYPVDRFYPIQKPSQKDPFVDLDTVHRQFITDYLGRFYHDDERNWHENYLPVARLAGRSDALAVRVRPAGVGRVFVINHNPDYDPRNAAEVAASFAEFLAAISPVQPRRADDVRG